jgi:hypothetical protein
MCMQAATTAGLQEDYPEGDTWRFGAQVNDTPRVLASGSVRCPQAGQQVLNSAICLDSRLNRCSDAACRARLRAPDPGSAPSWEARGRQS